MLGEVRTIEVFTQSLQSQWQPTNYDSTRRSEKGNIWDNQTYLDIVLAKRCCVRLGLQLVLRLHLLPRYSHLHRYSYLRLHRHLPSRCRRSRLRLLRQHPLLHLHSLHWHPQVLRLLPLQTVDVFFFSLLHRDRHLIKCHTSLLGPNPSSARAADRQSPCNMPRRSKSLRVAASLSSRWFVRSICPRG